jgi:hypothetical protein
VALVVISVNYQMAIDRVHKTASVVYDPKVIATYSPVAPNFRLD